MQSGNTADLANLAGLPGGAPPDVKPSSPPVPAITSGRRFSDFIINYKAGLLTVPKVINNVYKHVFSPPLTRDGGYQTENLTFSPLTMTELIPTLNHEQAARELKYFKAVNPNIISKPTSRGAPTRAAINNCLTTNLISPLVTDFDILSDNINNCHKLISSFSYISEKLDKRSNDIERNLKVISELVSELQQGKSPQVATHNQVNDLDFDFDSSSPTNQPPITSVHKFGEFNNCTIRQRLDSSDTPYIKLTNTPFSSHSINELNQNTEFCQDLKTRSAAYYGPHPYRYAGVVHPPRDMTENKLICDILTRINADFPNIILNSALIQKYEGCDSSISSHADNEPEIDTESIIVTVSFGQSRTMIFHDTVQDNIDMPVVLDHGDILLMSRRSQDRYKHSIPPCTDPDTGTRISITFRNIVSSTQQTNNLSRIPPIHKPRTGRSTSRKMNNRPTRPSPGKILLATDSILDKVSRSSEHAPSLSIDRVYQLDKFLDIDPGYLSNFDTVIISTGVNDLSRYDHTAASLFERVKSKLPIILKTCSSTKFIFRALIDTNYVWLNNETREFNMMMYKLARQQRNLFFFDTCVLPPLPSEYLYRTGNGVHLHSRAARALLHDLMKHATYLTIRPPNTPPPGLWPIRPFYHRFDM